MGKVNKVLQEDTLRLSVQPFSKLVKLKSSQIVRCDDELLTA